MNMYEIITKKKRGGKLTEAEIEFFVNGFTCGEIPDYQASALLMAICINGMDDEETGFLTAAMRDSGDKTDLSCFGGRAVTSTVPAAWETKPLWWCFLSSLPWDVWRQRCPAEGLVIQEGP